jgi:2-oxo-4-hydroxy-4-carboxy-5-ureidoimidazoline decarboxylase
VAAPPDVATLDTLPAEDAAAALGPLFEAAPAFLRRLVAARPFGTETELFARAEMLALALPEPEAIELVNAHPRLGAPPDAVSALSFREQGYDRATAAASASLAERLATLNDAYERRFGFRYCVFVAGRPRQVLIPEWEARLEGGERDEELRRALRDVVAIARDRYRRLRAEAAAPVEEGA